MEEIMQLKTWEQEAKAHLIKICFQDDLPTDEEFDYLWELVFKNDAFIQKWDEKKSLLNTAHKPSVKKALVLYYLNPRMMVRFFGKENQCSERKFSKHSVGEIRDEHLDLIADYIVWFTWLQKTHGENLKKILLGVTEDHRQNALEVMQENISDYVSFVCKDISLWEKVGLPNNPAFQFGISNKIAKNYWYNFFNKIKWNAMIRSEDKLVLANCFLERFKATELASDAIKSILHLVNDDDLDSFSKEILFLAAKFAKENDLKGFHYLCRNIEDYFESFTTEEQILFAEATCINQDFYFFNEERIEKITNTLKQKSMFSLAGKIISCWMDYKEHTSKQEKAYLEQIELKKKYTELLTQSDQTLTQNA